MLLMEKKLLTGARAEEESSKLCLIIQLGDGITVQYAVENKQEAIASTVSILKCTRT
ncbi:MAG: hypothetical protein HC899_06325 [Leptolyngbyaceae cyanobacterium SM1_4_3]|nr:hypothetical protein [Leptolyngbyaceae cyanobacterium SM1_4_3]NJN91195.1 hypothetical protein [Leptolyngbyaceae cyanobacterium SL_5_14]